MSGSCSPVTGRQIDWAEANGLAGIRLDVAAAVDEHRWGRVIAAAIEAATAALAGGRSPLVYTARGPDDAAIPTLKQAILAAGENEAEVNARIGHGLGEILRAIVTGTDIRRVAIAGGDTSGHALAGLGIIALEAEVALTPACGINIARSDDAALDGLEVALKGGQMGPVDYFGMIERGRPLEDGVRTMTKIALLGAGGKMGVRLATNLRGSPYEVMHVEITEEGRKRLKDATGADCVDRDAALRDADVVLMAVPDALIGKIAKTFIADVKPGCAIIMLDAAAPHAGELPERKDVTYFVTHPCHPSIFRYEPTREAQKDYFGGVKAEQAIVCALMQGPEAHYALCEDIAKTIYKPVTRSHRVTVEQMALLEPGLSETVGATLVTALRKATDVAIAEGRAARRGDGLHARPSRHRDGPPLRGPSRPLLRRRDPRHREGDAAHLPRRLARRARTG